MLYKIAVYIKMLCTFKKEYAISNVESTFLVTIESSGITNMSAHIRK